MILSARDEDSGGTRIKDSDYGGGMDYCRSRSRLAELWGAPCVRCAVNRRSREGESSNTAAQSSDSHRTYVGHMGR